MYCLIYSEALASYNLSLYTLKNNNNNLEPDLLVLLLNWWFSTMIYVADYISVFPLTVKHLDARMCKELTAGFELYPHLFKLFISLTDSSFPLLTQIVSFYVCVSVFCFQLYWNKNNFE